jgi:energy-coupling factor transport system substrate-specific component
MTPRAAAALVAASAVGFAAFFWPFLAAPESAAVAHAADAPLVFAVLLPVLLAVVLTQLTEPGSGAKAVAMLGVLSALVAVLRPLGAGHAGFEPFWFLIVVGGRALGPGFGFALGSVGVFGSALLTGGVGPWLPFQMIGAAWVGMGAGLLGGPRTGRAELVLLAGYGAVASVAYGFLLNAWFWPFFTGAGSGVPSELAFDPAVGPLANLGRLLVFSLATSLGYDLPRAVLTAVLVLAVGGPLLRAIRRAARRAAFDAPVAFQPPSPARPVGPAAQVGP